MRLTAALLISSGLLTGAELSVRDAVLYEFSGGRPVRFDYQFPPGSLIPLSFRIAGFSSVGEDRKVQLAYRIEPLDSAGIPLAQPKSGTVEVELAPEDKDWLPKIDYELVLPPRMPPGEYVIRLTIEDRQSGTKAEHKLPLLVGGRTVELAETLAVRGFQLMRSEKEMDVLAEGAAVSPGAHVMARFDIVGFKLGDGNQYKVSYGVQLWGPAGKMLFGNAVAATDNGKSFYPIRVVPGSFRLDLDPKAAPGTYRVVLLIRDEIAGATLEAEQSFEVR